MKNKIIAIASIALLPLSVAFAQTSSTNPNTPATQAPVTGDSASERNGMQTNTPGTGVMRDSQSDVPVKEPSDFNNRNQNTDTMHPGLQKDNMNRGSSGNEVPNMNRNGSNYNSPNSDTTSSDR